MQSKTPLAHPLTLRKLQKSKSTIAGWEHSVSIVYTRSSTCYKGLINLVKDNPLEWVEPQSGTVGGEHNVLFFFLIYVNSETTSSFNPSVKKELQKKNMLVSWKIVQIAHKKITLGLTVFVSVSRCHATWKRHFFLWGGKNNRNSNHKCTIHF